MRSDKGECYDGFEKASGKNWLAGRKKDKGRMCKKRAMEYHKNKNCGDRRNHCVISSYVYSRNAGEEGKNKRRFYIQSDYYERGAISLIKVEVDTEKCTVGMEGTTKCILDDLFQGILLMIGAVFERLDFPKEVNKDIVRMIIEELEKEFLN